MRHSRSRLVFGSALLMLAATLGCGAGDRNSSDPNADESEDALTTKVPAKVSAIEERNWDAPAGASSAEDGDILDLRLFSDGTYVRRRCYGAGCANAPGETDRFRAFTSKGKTYLEFWSFERKLVAPVHPPKPGTVSEPEYDDVPAVVDTYELKTSPNAIKLRKTYSSRWVKLVAIEDDALCTQSGGVWTPPGPPPPPQPVKIAPTTKGSQPAQTPANGPVMTTPPPTPGSCACANADEGYVAGAGGCRHIAISSEAACDDTNGSYTDDDSTRLGTYCQCGIGRTMEDDGCTDL